jgi:phosphotransferase system enzyme I (PtsI)
VVAADRIEAESARAVAALTAVAADLADRAAAATEPAIADILRAQAMMADDPLLRDSVTEAVRGGVDPATAIDRAIAEHRDAFAAAGGYLAERVADLDDIRDRAIAFCLDLPMPGLPSPGQPFVLSARDLAPADTAGLDPAVVLALVTEEGGPTAHTAIVARTLGIPAIVRCTDILTVADGTLVAVDATVGTVQVKPDAADLAAASLRERQRRARLAQSSGPGRTADGHPVALLANIGSAADLVGPAGGGAEGVGLFRPNCCT